MKFLRSSRCLLLRQIPAHHGGINLIVGGALVLIVPGGFPDGAPATVRKIKKAQEITKSFFERNKPVASICHGPWTLVSADVVRGRRLTSYWHDGVLEEIKEAGGIWEDKDVIVDGNLVTSRWPMDLPVFMREVVKIARRVG
jgi:protease I